MTINAGASTGNWRHDPSFDTAGTARPVGAMETINSGTPMVFRVLAVAWPWPRFFDGQRATIWINDGIRIPYKDHQTSHAGHREDEQLAEHAAAVIGRAWPVDEKFEPRQMTAVLDDW